MMTENNKILLLTLVHPDLLPPVYAVAQSLRDLNYNIHILTFDSLIPSSHYSLGDNITVESAGRHYDAATVGKLKLRRKFIEIAREFVKSNVAAIITFCPFSYYCGLKIKNNTPVAYLALELSDFDYPGLLRSPLTGYRNMWTLKNAHKADLLATPSVQRSAWLAGRCHLPVMPHTILNTAYLSADNETDSLPVFRELVPPDFWDKKVILYTGAVNTATCIMELVQAFELIDDKTCVLIINGVRENQYCEQLTAYVNNSKTKNRIKLLPYLSRNKVLALQANAHIGVNLTWENARNTESAMPAPNKLGEYLIKDLFVIGIMNEYLRPFEMNGIAALAASRDPADIAKALAVGLVAVGNAEHKNRTQNLVRSYYCMQKQIKPIVDLLNKAKQ